MNSTTLQYRIPIWFGNLAFHLIWPILVIYFKTIWTKLVTLKKVLEVHRKTDIQVRQNKQKLGRENFGASECSTFSVTFVRTTELSVCILHRFVFQIFFLFKYTYWKQVRINAVQGNWAIQEFLWYLREDSLRSFFVPNFLSQEDVKCL